MVDDKNASDVSGEGDRWAGRRVVLVGRLAGMTQREAAALLRARGAVVVDRPGPGVDLIVVAERGLPLADEGDLDDAFDGPTREAIRAGAVEVVTETDLWARLGLVDLGRDLNRLYTPGMLAELLGVPVAIIRRWHRRGLIAPAREVRRLPYFDFEEVATARRLAQLLAAGASPAAIEKKLQALRDFLPGVERPLAQLSVIVEGKQILLRQGDGLLEPGGQMRFDFPTESPPAVSIDAARLPEVADEQTEELARSPDDLIELAAACEEAGDLAAAAETYRAAMAAAGPSADLCFQVAEILYRLGDLSGARERYYVAIELDEDFVEARANLGCLLAEQGEMELAAAALAGALAYHPDYADAHYHLAKTLERLGRADEARRHWQAFLDLSPESPWAAEAADRVKTT
ncbi:MAG: tetratricopeptide repeat protein [Pirellulales bacterium]|nr:tetratricopeptide repeat protein [Pirellulales bacterium]